MGLKLWTHCNVASMQADADQPYGLIADAALVVQGERIAWVGPRRDLPTELLARCSEQHDAQGALITDQEIQNIVGFITKQGKPSYEMEIHQQLSKPAANTDIESGIDEDEEIIQQCIEVIRSEQKASVSLMQRRLRLGYTRAARIMDELENRGIVGPSKGAEPRDILIDLDGGGADGSGRDQPGTAGESGEPPHAGE